jgi:hypothetical protein
LILRERVVFVVRAFKVGGRGRQRLVRVRVFAKLGLGLFNRKGT